MHDQSEHRKRVRKRFQDEGLDSFDPVHVLEFLLFYSIPRIDTKPIARALLNHFGSFNAVLEGTKEELMMVPGVGESTAVFIQLLNATGRYYQVNLKSGPQILNTIPECAAYLSRHYCGRRVETVFLLLLDAKKRLLSCQMLSEGEFNFANIPTRKVVELVLSTNASAVVIAHNHPGGLAVPSAEDILATRKLEEVLESLGVTLADHLVFTDDDWVSILHSRSYIAYDGRRQL